MFEEHNKRLTENNKKFLGMVRKENYLKTKEEIEHKKRVLKQRAESKIRLSNIREVKKRPVYNYNKVYLNYLHKSVLKSEITPEMQEKEEEFGENYIDRI